MTDLERYLDDFGDRLHAAKPPPRRRGLALGGALALATAVIVAVLLLAPSGGGGSRPGPVDAIAAARKALDPAGVILHMRIRTDLTGGGIKQAFQETWTAQDPQRWRLRQWNVGGPRMNRGPSEMAYGGGEQSSYEKRRLSIRQGFKDDTPQTRLPNFFSQQGGDPDTDLRALLASGKLKDEGEKQVEGRTVRRLTSDDGLRSMVFDVDPVSFAPLGGSMTYRGRAGTKIPTMTLPFVVEAFERLPITAETEKLLRVIPPAGTKKTVYTAADMRRFQREYREWRKHCRKVKKNSWTCPGTPPTLTKG